MWSLQPDVRLNERFRLRAPVGSGGMSQVWQADDEVLGRVVAVKVLTAAIAADPSHREAVWREARAAARLAHPHVTRLYDYGEAALPDGSRVPYLVMELVEGQDMASRLAAGPLPWHDAARIGAQIAAALAAAHRLGVVHHDVKPGNVMLTADGAKVLDFGVAAVAGAVDPDVLAGTPTYAAPERLWPTAAHPASDVYSLGVVLHEALTGHPPATLLTWEEAAQAHRDGTPAPDLRHVPDLPPDLSRLITACLAPEASRRPDAGQVATTLARAAGVPEPGGQPTIAMPRRYAAGAASPPPPAPPTRLDEHAGTTRTGGSRLMLAGVAVAAAVLALLVALVVAAIRDGSGTIDTAGQAPDGEPSGTTTAGPTDPATPTDEAGGEPPADDPLAVVSELEAAISNALREGVIDRDAAGDLREELFEIEEELTEPDYDVGERIDKVRKAADELREEIDDLLEDDELPPPFADELLRLLAPLLDWRG